MLSSPSNDSRVYGTIPGQAGNFDGEKLLLRDNGQHGYRTYMHPDLQHAILFGGNHKNEWLNEAHGTIDLAEEILKDNPRLIYRAVFIGGGEATQAELLRTVELSRKFAEQVQIVLAWDSGGVAHKAAGRRLTRNTHRIILNQAAIHEALTTPVTGGRDKVFTQSLMTLTGQRAYHESRGLLAPNEAASQIASHLIRSSSHLLKETSAIASRRQEGDDAQRLHRHKAGGKLLKDFESRSRVAARGELDISTERGRSTSRYALDLVVAETVRAQENSNGEAANAPPSEILAKNSALSQISPGSVVSISGMRYALVNDSSGSPVLVHRREDAAITDAVTTLLPSALAGERVQGCKSLTEESLIPGLLSTVPLIELRWSAITPGTRIVYSGIDDRQLIATDEILSINPSPRGSHAKLVTFLRVASHGSSAALISEERIEASLVVPPTELAGAHSVQVYKNRGTASMPLGEVVLRERPEVLRTTQLRRVLSAVFESGLLGYQDYLDSTQVSAFSDLRKVSELFTPQAYEDYFQQMLAKAQEQRELSRLFEKWCRELDSSSSNGISAFIHAMASAIEGQPTPNTSQNGGSAATLEVIRDSLTQAPQAVHALKSTEEVQAWIKKLYKQAHSSASGLIQTYSGPEIDPSILAACARIAHSRVIRPPQLRTPKELAQSFSQGGFMYSEYSPVYLKQALDSGALLLTALHPASGRDEPVAFSLLYDGKALPQHLNAILPALREKNVGYFEVVAADAKASTPLTNVLLFKSTLGRAALRGGSGAAAITHVHNQRIQNLLAKAGFEVDPSQRVSLASPHGGTDGKYRLYTRSFTQATVADVSLTRGATSTQEGYLTSRPDEFRQMSYLAKTLGDQPITWFSFGVDSLTGEKLRAVKQFIVESRLSELQGVATYIPTKTIVRLPHSEGESVQWRVDQENGAGVIESLLQSRADTRTTVGLALFEPNDSLANQDVRVLAQDGSYAELRVMRGNDEKRTVYNYNLCNHALKFRVTFPDVANQESIWGLGNYRALEFLTFFKNRMCIFAGGGTTVLRGIMQAAQTALEQRQGKTTIVLLKGTGGMTDHVAENLDEILPARSTEGISQFLEVVIVDISEGADALEGVLRNSGRLSQ